MKDEQITKNSNQIKELITQFSQSKIERYRDFISNLSSEVDDEIEIKKLIY